MKSYSEIGKRPIGVDLFAGTGGMSLGFEQAGFDVAAAVEYDPVHAATHEFNFPSSAAICRSVAQIDGVYVRKHSRIDDQRVDVVFGGAPCQGFSMIGKRALDDPRNSLVHHFVRLVVELNASYFVFENVRGLTIGAHRRFLEEIIREFRKKGYAVLEDYKVLNAARYGVPQNRQRLFLIGARTGFPLPEYPPATHEPVDGNGESGNLFFQPTPTVWDALRDLPEADDYEELLRRDWVKAEFNRATDYSAPLRGDTSDPKDYSILGSLTRACLHLVSGRSTRICPEDAFFRLAMAIPNLGSINWTQRESAIRFVLEPPAIGARLLRRALFIPTRHAVSRFGKRRVCIPIRTGFVFT